MTLPQFATINFVAKFDAVFFASDFCRGNVYKMFTNIASAYDTIRAQKEVTTMFGKNRIVNKHGLKMRGLKKASGITKRTPPGRLFWNPDTGNIDIILPSGCVLKHVDDEEAIYKEYLNSLYGNLIAVGDTKNKADIKYLYLKLDTLSIIYDGPMTMQEIADAFYEEYREEMEWRKLAEENGWRVKE